MNRKNVVLYTLQTFSATGGIQKMTRTLAHVLWMASKKNHWNFVLRSAYDANADLMERYLPAGAFRGYNLNRIGFTFDAVRTAGKQDVIILSHINLSIVGLLIKRFNPACELWLIAHGIEVWRPLSRIQRLLLKKSTKIISVSDFTMQHMIKTHGADPAKCLVINNVVDSFMKFPDDFVKPEYLMNKHSLTPANPVVFTLTRLASTELYKGHDMVIRAIGQLKNKFPGIRYVLSGKYDYNEEIRIRKLIAENNVGDEVILTGFVDENELSDYFLLADVFVLPSKKEGFGIVFVEALACGVPVICGNADGSVDAVRNGELGTTIDPDNLGQLVQAIESRLLAPITPSGRRELQQQCRRYFNEENYMERFERLIKNEYAA